MIRTLTDSESNLVSISLFSLSPLLIGSVDVVYQVLDVCAAHAGATSVTDALDVGLVCIRNLQVTSLPLPFSLFL